MHDVTPEAFQAVVEDAWSHVPDKFRGRIDNVALLIEDEPSEETRKEEHLTEHETLLGLYHGIPESARGQSYGVGATLPDTITLYRLPILEEAEELLHARKLASFEDALQEAVRETLWHEVGHYFGLGESEIRVREHKGSNRYQA